MFYTKVSRVQENKFKAILQDLTSKVTKKVYSNKQNT